MLTVRGASGRIGAEVLRLAALEKMPTTTDPEHASVTVLALPTDAARQALAGLEGHSVIDMSGAVKRDGTGIYGLGAHPQPGVWYGNPGCIAAAVILAIRRSGVQVNGPLHISAVGGSSYAPRGQDGVLRVARRLHEHPHVPEIEAAIGGSIASFVPIVSYGTERGLVVSVSGTGAVQAQGEPFDAQAVVGTDGLLLRAVQAGPHFTLTAAIDNLSFPAAHAVRMAQALIR